MIRVVILEDQYLLLQSLWMYLSRRSGISVAAVFSEPESMLADRETLAKSDVALLDIRLGSGTAFSLVQELSRQVPALRGIWLSSIEEDYLLEQAFQAGLPGFVHKDDSLDVLVTAIETVAAGRQYYSEAVLALRAKSRGKPDRYSLILSEREQEILRYIGAGMSNEEAASLLGLSAGTVKTHRRNIMNRLGLHSAMELQSYALSIGMVDAKSLRLPSTE